MFRDLFFLILVLLLISFISVGDPTSWTLNPSVAFALGSFFYLCLLGLILIQRRIFTKVGKQQFSTIVNVECLIFLALYQYILGAHRLFVFGNFQSGAILSSFLLYIGALTLFYATYYSEADHQIRLLIPFAIPFLFFTLLGDLGQFLSPNFLIKFFNEWDPYSITFTLLFLCFCSIFFPPLLIVLWKCESLKEGELKMQLDNLCRKAKFSHGGFKIWGVMEGFLTAAIIGIAAPFRYILFTKKLLRDFSTREVEAILAHEIGHSQHYHMIFYSIIFFGIALLLSFSTQLLEPLEELFLPIKELFPIAAFILFATLIAIYFRFVFGFFSRLFERQADLHVFALKVPPEALIEALDKVGIKTGFSHSLPNWHHHSIQDRINFLKEAIQHPEKIAQHHKKVRRAFLIFFLLLIAIATFL